MDSNGIISTDNELISITKHLNFKELTNEEINMLFCILIKRLRYTTTESADAAKLFSINTICQIAMTITDTLCFSKEVHWKIVYVMSIMKDNNYDSNVIEKMLIKMRGIIESLGNNEDAAFIYALGFHDELVIANYRFKPTTYTFDNKLRNLITSSRERLFNIKCFGFTDLQFEPEPKSEYIENTDIEMADAFCGCWTNIFYDK